jgi:hypothetical protein
MLPNGKVLVVGGQTSTFGSPAVSTVEFYDSASGAWTPTGALTSARFAHTETLLPDGRILAAGGIGIGYVTNADIYDPSAGTWSAAGSMRSYHQANTATLLPNGNVLIAGGPAELYSPTGRTWKATGPPTTPRQFYTATLLPNGKVLVAGGTSAYTGSAELYDPTTGYWTATGALKVTRRGHTATLLPNGKVLVAAGYNYLASTELYDPATGTWTLTGSLATGRQWHTAALLPNGKVLIVGGNNGGNPLASAELYDVGLGSSAACQPQVTACTSPVSLGGSLALSGSGFLGVSAGSGGNTQDSPANSPLVQLRSLESGQTLFLLSTNWQTNSFTSTPVWGFPPGYALATVFVNGIPSTGTVLNIQVPIPTTPTLATRRLTNGALQFAFTNTVGALFAVLATTNPALPLGNWTTLGGVTEVLPGQFQFTDAEATNTPSRFYRVRSL